MLLKEYLDKHSINKTKFCKHLNVSPQYFYRVITGKCRPSIKLAEKIEEITEGKVNKMELLFGPKDEKKDQNAMFEEIKKKLESHEKKLKSHEKRLLDLEKKTP